MTKEKEQETTKSKIKCGGKPTLN